MSKEKRMRAPDEGKKRFELKKYRTPIIICAAVLAALGITAAIMSSVSSGGTVNVYDVSYFAITDAMMGGNETYGPVGSDRMQTIFVTDTQRVTEVFVTEGQEVKQGDPLLSYDTTLSTLEVDKAALDLNNKRMQLRELEKQRKQIGNMRPYAPAPEGSPEAPDAGVPITGITLTGGTGAKTDPFIYSVGSTFAGLDEIFVNDLLTGKTEVWAVFQTREGDMTKGAVLTSFGIRFTRTGTGYAFLPFDGSGFIEYIEPVVSGGDLGFGGPSAAEIAAMRAALDKQIRDLDLEIRIAEVSLKQMEREIDAGIVYAKYDGVITSLLDEQTARDSFMPILKLSGGGGYYVNGSISEMLLDDVNIGDTVTINSWENGMVYTGTIVEKSDIPLSDNGEYYYYGNGNSNVSYYPYTVFIDGSADLEEGMYVSMVYTSSTSANSMYLENPYILTEGGKSYVWVDEDGTLSKRQINTGASMWGSYTQILSGLSMSDRIAFPYGREVKQGAKTRQADINELYESMYY